MINKEEIVIELVDEHEYLSNEFKTLIHDIIYLSSKYVNITTPSQIDVTIVDNATIHQLNVTYRQVDRPTDVLSFPLQENESELFPWEEVGPVHLGDIVISYDKLVEQAESYEHSIERELGFLTVHGFLHLNGYDHQTKEEEAVMFGLQEAILKEFGLDR